MKIFKTVNHQVTIPKTTLFTPLNHNHTPYPYLWLGTWRMGGMHFGPYTETQALSTLSLAYDNGIRHFDTAAFYAHGHADRVLAKAFKKKRSQIFISSKGGLHWQGNTVVKDASKQGLKRSLEASLHALNTDYIDLFSLHWPDPKVPIEESIDALLGFQKKGDIRHWGLCNLSIEQVSVLPKISPPVLHQVHHNLLAPNTDLLKASKDKGLTTGIYSPLAEGFLGTSQTAEGRTGLSKKDFRHKSPYFSEKKHQDRQQQFKALASAENLNLAQYVIKQYAEDVLIDHILFGARTPAQLESLLTKT